MIGLGVVLAVALVGAGEEPLIIDGATSSAPSPWSGSLRALALVAGDLTHERPAPGARDEDTLALMLEVAVAVSYEPSPIWDAHVRARLRARVSVAADRVSDDIVPDLVEARLTLRPEGGPEIDLGWLADVRWPELASPHPVDLSLGPRPPTGEALDRQRAIPALHATQRFGPLRAELLWQVVQVPMRLPLSGSDWAPIVIAGQRDVADRPTLPGLEGGAAGARVRLRRGDLELGLTWLWQVDPVPTDAGYQRQHRVAADVKLVTGPLHWRAEVAGIDRQSAWTRDLTNERKPRIEAVLSATAAPLIMLDFEIGMHALHAFDASARYLGMGPDDVDVFLRLGLLLAYDGVVRLDLEARLAVMRADGDVLAALAVRASAHDEIALGLTVFGGNAVAAGRGALYDADDALWVRWARTF